MMRSEVGRHRTRACGLLVALAVAGCGGTLVPASDAEFGRSADPGPIDPDALARSVIDARDIDGRVDFLASDAMAGRATGSEELERAAAWLAEQFYAMGVEPAGDDGGFVQFWPQRGADSAIAVPNVVAALPGSDVRRAQEHVILTAHFDHVGTGAPDEDGDSIYNGADDNASGVAALLAVAEAFAALPTPPARPVLFLVTSGGEQGLGGAAWFAEHPPVFLSNAVGVISMDRVGRRGADAIEIVGHGYSSLGPLVERLGAEAVNLRLTARPYSGDDLFRSGDHYPLAARGVPAVALTLSPDAPAPTPSDETVDPAQVARVARLAFLAAYELATMEEKPEWTEEGRRATGSR